MPDYARPIHSRGDPGAGQRHFTPQMDAPGVKEKCLAEMREIYHGRLIWGEDLMRLPLRPDKIPHMG